jgi:hypothetical protein
MFLFLLIKISAFRKAVMIRSLFLPFCSMLNEPLSALKCRQELKVMYGQDYFFLRNRQAAGYGVESIRA